MTMIARKKHLTADEVKKLPVGTRIDLHGRDRHGYSTVIECTIVQSGKSKKLAYTDYYGARTVLPIRKIEGPIHYYTEG